MALRLRDLKEEARALARTGQLAAALAAHEHMLATNPLDSGSRRKIADLLLALGERAAAVEVYRVVARHDLLSGHPLPALAACKVLAGMGEDPAELVRLAAASYAHGSPALAKFAARQAPVDLSAEIEPRERDRDDAADLATLIRRAHGRAVDLAAFVQYPHQFLPIPFFSELPSELFPTAIESLRLIRAGDRQRVVEQGQPGTSFYFVATGELRVLARRAGPAGGPAEAEMIERTRLHEGALFGEMALVTEQPRTATVEVVGEADLLEMDRASVARLCAEVPALAERLDRFARERLLKNLLATSPLFKPFDHKQQMELIRRFEGHDVAPATVIIREGEAGQGLFVILLGEVEVSKSDGLEGDRPVARLGAGDVFGEMSLLDDRPTNATVRALTASTLLFLGREYFRRLVDAVAPLRQYFEQLSQHRREGGEG